MSLTKLSGRQIETPVDISAVNLTGVTTIGDLNATRVNVTGVSTFSANINVLDNAQIRVGTGSDLLLFHNGNDSFVYENGTGSLVIVSSLGDITLNTTDGSPNTVERFRVKGDSGHIGIGTTNPLGRLQVGAAGTSVFVVTSTGSVGIGTTNPFDAVTTGNGVHIYQPENAILRVQSGSTGNRAAEFDLISSGSQSAFIDYGPNSLVYRTSNSSGDISLSNVVILDNTGRVAINTSATTGGANYSGKLRVYADGNSNDHGIHIDTNTKTNNTASLLFTNTAGAGTSDNFNAGFALMNGYGGAAINNSVQFSIANANTFPRTFAYVDRNAPDSRFFALSSNLTESIFKVGIANETLSTLSVDINNNRVGIATSGYNSATLAVSGGIYATGVTTVSSLSSTYPVVYKNLVDNGSFLVDQRNAGTISTSTSSVAHRMIDRWLFAAFGGDFINKSLFTFQQFTGADIPTVGITSTYFRIKCNQTLTYTASGLGAWFAHVIEPIRLDPHGCGTTKAKPFFLSFWAKTNVGTGFTMGCTLEKNNPLETHQQSVYIPGDDTWRKFILRYRAPVSGISTTSWGNTSALHLLFGMTSNGSWLAGTAHEWSSTLRNIFPANQTNLLTNTSNYVDISSVQLEVGEAATEFEVVPFEQELIRCQRFLETNIPYGTKIGIGFLEAPHTVGSSINQDAQSGSSDSSGNIFRTIIFKTPKRTEPAMKAFRGPAGSTIDQWLVYNHTTGATANATVTFDSIGRTQCRAYAALGANGVAARMEGYWIANAEF